MIGPKLPWPVRVVVSFLLRRVVGDEKFATLFDASCHKSVTEMQHWQLKKATYVRKFREEVRFHPAFNSRRAHADAFISFRSGERWDWTPFSARLRPFQLSKSAKLGTCEQGF